jgi:hypothetical protein
MRDERLSSGWIRRESQIACKDGGDLPREKGAKL